MISFFEKRKLRKQIKDHLTSARHARNMREDIADPSELEALKGAETAVLALRDSGEGNAEKLLSTLEEATEKIYPASNRTGVRENVEVVIVALGAAMAIRAFFFQPYKIPTGSMQPTLNGIQGIAKADSSLMDRQPFRFVKWMVTGTSYHSFEAMASGYLGRGLESGPKETYLFTIGGVTHKMPAYMFYDWLGSSDLNVAWNKKVSENHLFQKGETIWAGLKVAGDHILVNKMKYNFMQPERGDIAVFDTRNLEGVREDTFYIKRMVGLPGEKIQIKDDHYLMANGEIVEDPSVFKMLNEDPRYAGHTFAGNLYDNDAFILLGDDEYMMMGDNTLNSKDGRYFGGVPRGDFQGSAFFVYWPFREHWGVVR